MIDLHCHLLPAVDDGPADMEATVALGRALVEDGVDVVAATPHYRYDFPAVAPDELASRCADAQAALAAAGVPLRVVPGTELDVNAALLAAPELLRGLSLGGRGDCVLVETPYGPLSRNFEDVLFRAVSLKGLRVLLAHPERNPTFQRDPRRVEELVERGVLLQLTAGALLRPKKSQSRRLAVKLIEHGRAHVLASDAHGADRGRRPQLRAGVRAAAQIAPERSRWMVTDAPAALLSGRPLPEPPADGRRRSRRLF